MVHEALAGFGTPYKQWLMKLTQNALYLTWLSMHIYTSTIGRRQLSQPDQVVPPFGATQVDVRR